MEDTIITIKAEHIIENVINKSRFIAHIKPVESEEDAKAFINQVSTKHREATHNCFAYTIGDQMNIQKANDNGEPSGTAGVPMLGILKKLEIHNACVVVTRYFGGIKLGGGGLIRAYSGAVRDVIYDIGRVELKPAIPTTVTINYDLTGKFEYELESTSYLLRDQSYTDKVSYQIDVVASDYDEFIAFLNRTTSGNYDLEEGEVMRLPFDIPTD
ncbi:IMPACT family member yigZ [Staphylococcus saprophyticus]|uniref:IMPACT family member yigZ n=1 Tax=Staphylococcus saprophyticus TaxID=29385 RepID=A0A380HNH9_STASA|nr:MULTISPECIES: YigZ family protein [Staphylococcus]MBN6203328.1 YigZ family protein [Staphylococcus saprophyticus]MCC4220326.1 YigZ family protein [Staphylococcus saprophyticus]MDW3930082.1 YigZ family protein [Staphylococcus saprophyticus]MDW4207552.1 YigZ family protein [Staphylococcus saprophyticus]MDW4292421.1 YigZ family protein [Staphylococcus saprophyticus]